MRSHFNKILASLLVTVFSFGLSYGIALSQDGTVQWHCELQGYLPSSFNVIPALGQDGSIYVVDKVSLYAISPAGAQKWQRFITDTVLYPLSSPAIGPDGTIYLGSDSGHIYAVKPDGTLHWDLELPIAHAIIGSPAIGHDGTIYVAHGGAWRNNAYYAINPDGTIKWQKGSWLGINVPPAIGPDGTIYFIDNAGTVLATSPQGGTKWTFNTIYGNSIAIGPDGTIYINDNIYFYAVNPDGTLKWKIFYFEAGYSPIGYPIIGLSGIIYLTANMNTSDGSINLLAIRPTDGSVQWSFLTGRSSGYTPSSLLGSDGTIYLILKEMTNPNDRLLIAAGTDNSIKWQTNLTAYMASLNLWVGGAYFSVMGSDGSIYVLVGGYLLSIRSSSKGLANSSWPMFQHDARRTGNFSKDTLHRPLVPQLMLLLNQDK